MLLTSATYIVKCIHSVDAKIEIDVHFGFDENLNYNLRFHV